MYLIWNNKGGVGKTFLTYLSTEYAYNVVVVDMCPQANVSEILLGGNGKGQEKLDEFFSKDLTIASYIKRRFSEGDSFLKDSKIGDYFIKVKEHNNQLPDNLYLLSGDNELDICSGIINYLSTSPVKNAWINSRNLLNDLIQAYEKDSEKKIVYFFDCNPSFSPYTELAIIASNRLIVPCTADNASMRGLKNVFRLLYGSKKDDNYTQFSEKILENKMSLPKIYRIAQNKSRSHQKNASKAFLANLKKTEDVIRELSKVYENSFYDKIREVFNIKDGNTLAAVINHTGQMLNDITIGKHPIHDQDVQISEVQKNILIDDVGQLVEEL